MGRDVPHQAFDGSGTTPPKPRRRPWPAVRTLKFEVRSESTVVPLHPAPKPAHHLPRNRSDGSGEFARGDLFVSLAADQHDVVARRDFGAGDVDGDHVHAHRTDCLLYTSDAADERS